MSKVEMVRYSYAEDKEDQRIGTLFTVRNGDSIIFGIARCKTNADKFDKEMGKRIAQGRVEKLLKQGPVEVTFNIEREDRFIPAGAVPFSQVTNLLQYFRNLNGRFAP